MNMSVEDARRLPNFNYWFAVANEYESFITWRAQRQTP